ncbi:MAG: hypothetical protein PVI30_13935 [Myxococcales bacterium]|jgi:hypothetical protein
MGRTLLTPGRRLAATGPWLALSLLLAAAGCESDSSSVEGRSATGGTRSGSDDRPAGDGGVLSIPGVDGGPRSGDGLTDSDGDGVSDFDERPAGGEADTDGDGIPNHLDDDDDGDGIPTKDELGDDGRRDSDDDGVLDYLDDDDDGDGILTIDELINGEVTDSDGDGTPDYLDRDPVIVDAGQMECAQANAEADLELRPVDIIFIVDNSGSMGAEIAGVQDNINTNFAGIIGGSGIDYRVILISEHGPLSQESICISGSLNPNNDCNAVTIGTPATLNEPIFYQYNVQIGSRDSWCRLLDTYTLPDPNALTDSGWSAWLRPEALKIFVEITDDRPDCATGSYVFDDGNAVDTAETAAMTFDTALLALDPEQFGTADDRNYIWHSIVALQANTPATDPWQPTDPVTINECPSAADPGAGYQALSNLTGGLKFPVCEGNNFDVVFQKIAEGVVEGTAVECDFPVPEAPSGETLDLSTVEVVYTPSDGSGEQFFREVDDEAACADNSVAFYFDGDTIRLCPETCFRVQVDPEAAVDVRFGCELPPPPDPPPPPDRPGID